MAWVKVALKFSTEDLPSDWICDRKFVPRLNVVLEIDMWHKSDDSSMELWIAQKASPCHYSSTNQSRLRRARGECMVLFMRGAKQTKAIKTSLVDTQRRWIIDWGETTSARERFSLRCFSFPIVNSRLLALLFSQRPTGKKLPRTWESTKSFGLHTGYAPWILSYARKVCARLKSSTLTLRIHLMINTIIIRLLSIMGEKSLFS